uniref:Uncharacterized protein n=1 Tax=Opuntia streptacantha TaxID=393608 RepID=A0A7C9CYI9_OPUST
MYSTSTLNQKARNKSEEPTKAPREPTKLLMANSEGAPLGGGGDSAEGAGPAAVLVGGGDGAAAGVAGGGAGVAAGAGAGVGEGGGDGGDFVAEEFLLDLSAKTTTTSFSFLRQLSLLPLMK